MNKPAVVHVVDNVPSDARYINPQTPLDNVWNISKAFFKAAVIITIGLAIIAIFG